MTWMDWMIVNFSIEEELALEKKARAVLNNDDERENAELCAQLIKQTHYQQALLAQAVQRIVELESETLDLVLEPPGHGSVSGDDLGNGDSFRSAAIDEVHPPSNRLFSPIALVSDIFARHAKFLTNFFKR